MKISFSIISITVLVSCTALRGLAQPQFAGTWEGVLNHGSCIGTSSRVKVKLELQQEKGEVWGTLSYYVGAAGTNAGDFGPLFSFPVRAEPKANSVTFRYQASDELRNIQFGLGYYIMGSYMLVLEWSSNQGFEQLSGLYRGGNGGNGELWLRKGGQPGTSPPEGSALLASLRKGQQTRKQMQTNALPAPVPAPAPPPWNANDSLATLFASEMASFNNLRQRTDSLQQQVWLPDTVRHIDLQIYDNAEIDGDTISLFVNDVLVLHKQRLSQNPILYKLYKPTSEHQIRVRMLAENLGSVPPNTALLQVVAGGEIRRVFMRSDLKTNGEIVFNWTL